MIGLIALAAAIQAVAGEARPVRAETVWSGDTVRLRLLGRSTAPVRVSYRIVATDGSNRADQSGDALIDADREVTMIDMTQSVGASWSATIDVAGTGITPYRLTFRRPVR